jgi:enoyl-CoA hydratase
VFGVGGLLDVGDLPRLIGAGRAADAILSGREVQAPEALAAGWINAILPTVDFHAHATGWAATIAQSPGPALYAAKKSIVLGTRLPFPDALALERQLFTDLSANSPTLGATAGQR